LALIWPNAIHEKTNEENHSFKCGIAGWFFEGPGNGLDWFVVDEEFFAYSRDLLLSVDTILFDRVTYQYMAGYWPSAPSDEIADKMNNLLKIVFSTTLENADWNNSRLVQGNVVEEVSTLKQQPGKDMAVLGSLILASSFLQSGLVDEYRVIVSPVLIGGGRPLFKGSTEMLKLRLLGTKTFASGVVMLTYRRE